MKVKLYLIDAGRISISLKEVDVENRMYWNSLRLEKDGNIGIFNTVTFT